MHYVQARAGSRKSLRNVKLRRQRLGQLVLDQGDEEIDGGPDVERTVELAMPAP
jgi:hypothetical protein